MKKLLKLYEKIVCWVDDKKVAWIVGVIFLLSLVPILYLSGINHASGDDFGFGAYTRQAWLTTGSLIEVFKASGRMIRQMYIGWQGTWFTIFLFTLQPEVFSRDAYVIVPSLMLIAISGGTALISYYAMVKHLELPRRLWIMVTGSVLFLSIQYVPRTTSGIFWFNGIMHYVIPHAMALIAIYCFARFYKENKVRFYVIGFIMLTLLGGANYLSALLALLGAILLIACNWSKRKQNLMLTAPIIAELIGLVISMTAPGNKVRGGEDFGFSISRAVLTVVDSIMQGIQMISTYVVEKPLVFILFIIVMLFAWETMKKQKVKYEFKYPGLFVFYMFGIYCAMYAPGTYAGVDTSSGVPNTIYNVFVITLFASGIYLLGWCYRKSRERTEKITMAQYKGYIQVPVILLCLILVYFNKGQIFKTTTDFYCIDFVVSGRAADYHEQMEERLAILLDDSIKDVVVPEMNSDQYPLMHMALLQDADAWTNTVTAQFYNKDSVVAIPRTEYEAER